MALYHFSRAQRLRGAPAVSRRKIPMARPARAMFPITRYVICTNPRSGSWLLSEGLASTSLAGNPREWFNTLEEQQHRARWRMDYSTDLTYARYLEYVRAESTTSNGISGIKLHWYQLAELQKDGCNRGP
jgi:trehalose 2-sulfotransferase